MDDWKGIAEARHLGIPAAEMDRLTAVMEALAKTFRRLLKTLPQDADLANNFQAQTPECE